MEYVFLTPPLVFAVLLIGLVGVGAIIGITKLLRHNHKHHPSH